MKKRKLRKEQNDKKIAKINIAMSILLVVVLSFVSVGYALYSQKLDLNGNINVTAQGKIAITDVELLSSINVKAGSIPTFTDDSVDFNLVFEKAAGSEDTEYQAIYEITIDNKTFYDYEFNVENFQPVIKNSSGVTVDPEFLKISLEGMNLGDSIPAGEEVKFRMIFDFTPDTDDTYSVDGDLNTDLEEEPYGNLFASIPDGAQGDLRESLGNDIAEFTVTVINTYQSSREFTLNIADTSHFRLVDSNGQPLGSFVISEGTTNTYTFYVKRVDGAIFTTASLTTGISLSYSDGTVNCGSVTLLVDESDYEDETPPIISNVTATINNAISDDTSDNEVGSVTVSWNGVDAESGVKKYYVIVNSPSGTQTYETENNNPSLTITGLVDGAYTFKVYGENNDGYKPTDAQIEIDTTAAGVCSMSDSYNFKWHYTVSLSSSSQYMKSLTDTKVNRGYNYTTTLSANDNTTTYTYTLPSSVTVTMGGESISTGTTSGHYRYTSSSGAFTVYGATGDISITARATRRTNGC